MFEFGRGRSLRIEAARQHESRQFAVDIHQQDLPRARRRFPPRASRFLRRMAQLGERDRRDVARQLAGSREFTSEQQEGIARFRHPPPQQGVEHVDRQHFHATAGDGGKHGNEAPVGHEVDRAK